MPELTLADVIEQGFAEIGTQRYGRLFDWGNPTPTACCVLGAAYWGVKQSGRDVGDLALLRNNSAGATAEKAIELLGRHYNLHQAVKHPMMDRNTSLGLALMTMNDSMHRSIADMVAWLRSEAEAGRIDISPKQEVDNA